MKSWLKKIGRLRTGGHGGARPAKKGIEAGRDVFAGVGSSEYVRKKNLLRKINSYWSQKRASAGSFVNERKPPVWRRRLLLALCLACSAALFVVSGGSRNITVLLQQLDYFRITAITVEGCGRTSVDRIRAASGVTVSSSLFGFEADAVSREVMRSSGWIKEANVFRRWPDTVVIEIEEYEPYALLTVGTGEAASLYYLDRSGVPFIRAGGGPDLDFPVITGLEGMEDARRRELLQDALYFLGLVGANNPNLPAQSVSEVHLDAAGRMVVYLVEHPFPIFIGTEDIREKYVRLRKVLEVLYRPRRTGMDIARVAYIRMDYLEDKVIVGYTESG